MDDGDLNKHWKCTLVNDFHTLLVSFYALFILFVERGNLSVSFYIFRQSYIIFEFDHVILIILVLWNFKSSVIFNVISSYQQVQPNEDSFFNFVTMSHLRYYNAKYKN